MLHYYYIDLDTVEDLNQLCYSNQLGHACSEITNYTKEGPFFVRKEPTCQNAYIPGYSLVMLLL